MGVITNKAQSVDRQSLTFKLLGTGAVAFVNAVKKSITSNVFDPDGFETEQSAADKVAFLWKMLNMLKVDFECSLEKLSYSVVCHANGFDGQFTAFEGVATVIPYNQLIYEPSDGSFLDGEFTAGRTGYYDVSAYFINTLVIAPAGETLRINIGGSHDVEQADTIIINTDTTQLQGSRTVYCQKGGTIYASLSHTYAGDIDFNSVAYPGAGGYISISYSARNTAANLV